MHLDRQARRGNAHGRIRDHRSLHHRAVEQVAAEHGELGARLERLAQRPDHVAIKCREAANIVGDATAVGAECVAREPLRLEQHPHHRAHAAGAVVILAQIFARGLEIDEQRHARTVALPVLKRQLDADMARDRVQMDRCVGRAADRRVDDDRIEERFARQDVGRLAVRTHQLDDRLTGLPGAFLPVAVRRGDRRRPRGSDMPSASVRLFIVVAVPIVLQ